MRRRAPWWLAGLAAAGACQVAGPGGGTLPPAVVQPGARLSGDEQEEAAGLLASAERSFEARRFFEVLRTTSDLLDRFPGSDVSGEALLLSARAELELDSVERAEEAAERYVALLAPIDPRVTSARLIQARAAEGDPTRQLGYLLAIRTVTDEELAEATLLARDAADALDREELEAVLAEAPPGGPLAPVAQSRHAAALLAAGEAERASEVAQAAIDGGATGPELVLAEGVLRGELPESMRRETTFMVASVLPREGPPGLAEFARLISEGIEVALSTVLGPDYDVTLVERDDQGDPEVGASLVPELETGNVAGAVGFLQDGTLLAAGQARIEGLPIISPTARTATEAGEGVYSLDGADPRAARAVARYSASRAHQRVAIVLPNSGTALEEADAFQEEAESLGVRVVGRFPYEPGATFFESQILGARDALRAAEIAALGLGPDDTLRVEMLEPVGMFVPIPREDVDFMAPQIAHFALDTLAIEVMGTFGWTSPQVLEAVEPRYLNGVVATAPVGAGPDSPGMQRFREAYEQHFQRSLTSLTPALGYDAALLLLEALRPGRLAPDEVLSSFRSLRDVEGATGIWSVIDDRVVRRFELVRIQNRNLVPVPAG
ncbi:MAG TPA: ABC transporter substrate-binding protein [Longimicrobiales bacterium]|nr:ABC transporter substrate-binding protein [Longimicrobiales bacterium]